MISNHNTSHNVVEMNRLKQFKDQYNKVLIQSDGAYMMTGDGKVPQSGKRSSSTTKKVKSGNGKKKKQMRENIRAAQELNASGGYFHKVPMQGVRQVY